MDVLTLVQPLFFRLEATADVLCATLLGNISVVDQWAADRPLASLARYRPAPAPSPSPPPMLRARPQPAVAVGAIPVRFSYDLTQVSTSPCSAQWHTCNATSSSPNCLQLYQAALSDVVLCSNDPQYLTVSSSGTSLDFSYAVSACLHRPVCVGGG